MNPYRQEPKTKPREETDCAKCSKRKGCEEQNDAKHWVRQWTQPYVAPPLWLSFWTHACSEFQPRWRERMLRKVRWSRPKMVTPLPDDPLHIRAPYWYP